MLTLCADARNEEAVKAVFRAKGRPADNPLIVHLADFSQAEIYTSYIPDIAYRLAEKFCPGALTMVLPKNDKIPMITSGGLEGEVFLHGFHCQRISRLIQPRTVILRHL